MSVGTAGGGIGASVTATVDSGADLFVCFCGQNRNPINMDSTAAGFTLGGVQASGIIAYQENTVETHACVGAYWLASALSSVGTGSKTLTRTSGVVIDRWSWINASGLEQQAPEDTDTADQGVTTSVTLSFTITSGALVLMGDFNIQGGFAENTGTKFGEQDDLCGVYTESGATLVLDTNSGYNTAVGGSFAPAAAAGGFTYAYKLNIS